MGRFEFRVGVWVTVGVKVGAIIMVRVAVKFIVRVGLGLG